MEITAVVIAAFLASMLTFFSSFGLGTILLPVFAIFFPVDVAIALTGLVHFTRLSVYATRFKEAALQEHLILILAAVSSAMAGTLLGNRLLKKITLRFIQIIVAVMLFLIAVALGMGLI